MSVYPRGGAVTRYCGRELFTRRGVSREDSDLSARTERKPLLQRQNNAALRDINTTLAQNRNSPALLAEFKSHNNIAQMKNATQKAAVEEREDVFPTERLSSGPPVLYISLLIGFF